MRERHDEGGAGLAMNLFGFWHRLDVTYHLVPTEEAPF
jgi:hypothetical protein